MKVLRRLELQQLEQQCWQFLISVIDGTNCEKLHELADVFDCPPLKLCAWRILQESIPGYALNPGYLGNGSDSGNDDDGSRARNKSTYQLKGNGLTGPCDIEEEDNEEGERGGEEGESDDDEVEAFPTIFKPDTFDANSHGRRGRGRGRGRDHDGSDNEEEEVESNSDVANTEDKETVNEDGTTIYASTARGGVNKNVPPPHPKTLPPTATASEVVRAWSAHLEYIHSQCNAPSGTRFSRRGNRNWERSFDRRRGRGLGGRYRGGGSRYSDDISSIGSIQIRPQQEDTRGGLLQQASRLYQSFASPSKSRQGQQQQEQHKQPNTTPASHNYRSNPTSPEAKNNSKHNNNGGNNDFENKTITLKDTVDWHAELTSFYEGIDMHAKVADLGNIMASWAGKEDLMLESLMKKYQTHLDRNRDLEAHLFKLLRYIHGDGRHNRGEKEKENVGGRGNNRREKGGGRDQFQQQQYQEHSEREEMGATAEEYYDN